ncbi:uncharacterized protein LOC120089167 [Benincasa hispida]|uniref:uncharacterized protein LOC120089167 n=1 Tax=Benincasa hispida TaxID=102211 RepID=UPI00190156C1|nr:uncharacterized protein LOC120089167 [Benincasa hispida]
MADNMDNTALAGNQGAVRLAQDPVLLATDRNIPMRNYAAPNLYDFSHGISRPTVEENASNFSLLGITFEGIRLYLFPYTLRDEAKRWAYSLELNKITSWDQLVDRFM